MALIVLINVVCLILNVALKAQAVTTSLNSSDPSIQYHGNWSVHGDDMFTSQSGASASLVFNGMTWFCHFETHGFPFLQS